MGQNSRVVERKKRKKEQKRIAECKIGKVEGAEWNGQWVWGEETHQKRVKTTLVGGGVGWGGGTKVGHRVRVGEQDEGSWAGRGEAWVNRVLPGEGCVRVLRDAGPLRIC